MLFIVNGLVRLTVGVAMNVIGLEPRAKQEVRITLVSWSKD